METIIDHKIRIAAISTIHTNSIIGLGKSNLASNNVEDILLPIVFVSTISTLERIPKCYQHLSKRLVTQRKY